MAIRAYFASGTSTSFCTCFYCKINSIVISPACYKLIKNICPSNTILTYHILDKVTAKARQLNSESYNISLLDLCLENIKNNSELTINEIHKLPLPEEVKQLLINYDEPPMTNHEGYYMQLSLLIRHHIGYRIIYIGQL